VILHYVGREAAAHRRVHPGGGVILHYSRHWQRSIAFQSEKSSLHRGKPGGGVSSSWRSRIVQNHRSTGINPAVAFGTLNSGEFSYSELADHRFSLNG
jgi:hypothetical protein